MNRHHWHVIGAGAMGCLFAQALARSGNEVTLLLRQAPAERQVSVTVEACGEIHTVPMRAETAIQEGAIENLLVTTKAYDACGAVCSIQHRLDASSEVLLMSNGMGFGEELQRSIPWLQPCFGTTTEGAYLASPGHVHHAGTGITRLGCQGRSRPAWFEAWRAGITRSEWVDDIELALWRKLAVNCVINPLTALHRCPNGDLRTDQELSTAVDALRGEVEAIAAACGWEVVARNLHQNVDKVIADTASNRSSMLQDVLHGRQTEIDYINGYLVGMADLQGLEAPLNRRLVADIKALT